MVSALQLLASLNPFRSFLLSLRSCLYKAAGLFCLWGCSSPSGIQARLDFFDHQRLASSYVRSPDPLKSCLYYGQELLLEWNVANCLSKQELAAARLNIELLFGDLTRAKEQVPLEVGKGQYVYSLACGEYEEKQGILSYKAFITVGERVLCDVTEHAWVDPLHLP